MYIKTLLKRLGRITMWVVGSFILLLIIAVFLIRLPSVQNYLSQKAVNYLEDKLETKVSLERLYISFPKSIVVEDFYIEDRAQDTLIDLNYLEVDLDMWSLVSGDILINYVDVNGLNSNIYTTDGSKYNFNFIIDAFSGGGKQKSPSPDQKVERKFHLGRIALDNMRIDFLDQAIGIEANVDLGSLHSAFDQFDPLENVYEAQQIVLKDSDIRIRQFKGSQTYSPNTDANANSSSPINLTANSISIDRTVAAYTSEVNGQDVFADIGKIKILPESFSLAEQQVDISEILMNESIIRYTILENQPSDSIEKQQEVAETQSETSSWKVKVGQLHGDNNRIRYDDQNQASSKGLDYAHMEWDTLGFNIQNIYFGYPRIELDILDLSTEEKSGFKVSELRTQFRMNDQSIALQDFVFNSPHSSLRTQTRLQFDQLSQLYEHPSRTVITSNWQESRLGVKDLLYFQPDLRDISAFRDPSQKLGLKGNFRGPVKNLSIPTFTFQYGTQTELKVKGSIAGLPQIDSTFFDLSFTRIRSSKAEWKRLMPDGTLPTDIQLPGSFTATGTFTGTIHDFESQLSIQSRLGNIEGSASFSRMGNENTQYSLQARFQQIELGRILQDTTTFGSTTFELSANGNQFSLAEMKSELQAQIKEICVNDYNYKDISLHARMAEQQLHLEGEIRDSNVIADFRGQALLIQDELFQMNGQLNIDGSDVYAINLAEEPLRAKGNIHFQLKGVDPDSFMATVTIKNGLLINKEREFLVDSVYTFANTLDSITEFRLYSDFIQGELKGNVDPMTFASIFQNQIDFYLNEGSDTLQYDSTDQQFDFQFKILETPLLAELLLPSLEELAPSSISGSYSSKDHNLNLNANFPKIAYSGFTIDTLHASIQSTRTSMKFSVGSERVRNEKVLIPNPGLKGKVENGILDLEFSIAPDTGKQYIYWAGKLSRSEELYQFQFDQGGFILNGESWEIPADHYLKLGENQILVQNLSLTNANREVALEKIDKNLISLSFREFKLFDLAKAFQQDETLFSGLLGGNIEMNPQSQPFVFDADLEIKDFNFMDSRLGTLSVEASNDKSGKYILAANISGNSNQASMNGSLQSGNEEFISDITVDIARLQLQSLEGFTLGYVENTSGYISGEFDISGALSDPKILGEINFHETQMRVTQLNTRYQIQDETLSFQSNKIQFDGFTLMDSVGSPADFSGYISLENLSKPAFQLDVVMSKFLLLNKKEKKNALFYGDLILNSELQIRGTTARPIISASAEIIEGSEVVFVMPTEDPRLETSGGIDEFIDRNQELPPIMEMGSSEDSIRSEITGLDLRATIRTDRSSKLTIYLDEGKGNFLQVQGDADLIFGMDPSGQMTLTGRYQVYDGKYQLLFRNVVKRVFQLQQGSNIVWTGNPLQARVDLTAIHTKYAEPLGLVQGQISKENQAMLNRYKQSYPFEVVLHMDEQLTSPSIDFDIRVSKEYRGSMGGELEAKLNRLNQNESELNKQVFALLVLGRFLPEDPFNVSGGGGIESTARRSVSKLLNAQLDKLSDKYIDAFELNLSLDSYEDYTTGEAEGRTELNIGVNKAFFNDRLTVSVGGNVELEGNRSQKQSASDLIGDISVEYALTENGTWKLRAYRKNEYEGIIDGDIIKTGASLIFSKDYNTISDLFNTKNKE